MNNDFLIDRIYEAGAMPERWPTLLKSLSDHFGARAGMLLASTPNGLLGLESDGLQELRQAYIDAGWGSDTTRVDWLLADRHVGFRTDLDFRSREQLAGIPLYSDFLIPHGLDAGAATLVDGAGGDSLLLSLEAFADHDHARAAIAELDSLRPHLARAAMLSAQMRMAQARAATAALEIMGAAAAMVSPWGGLRAANGAFEAFMMANGTDTDRKLRLFDREADRRFDQLLTKVNRGLEGGSIPIRSPAGVYALHVMPVRGVARDLFTDCSAILVAASGGTSKTPNETLVRTLYDLTPAEARIAVAIASGRKVNQIAIDTGVAVATVRAQLKAIFTKSHVRSQTELALLLADFARPALADE